MFYKPIIVGGESPITPTPPTPYVRPADWLDIPESTGEYDELYILKGVGVGENPFTVQINPIDSSAVIEFYDGINEQPEILTGAITHIVSRNYLFDDVSGDTYTQHNNTKQVLIRIKAERNTIRYIGFTQSLGEKNTTISNLIYEINGNIEQANIILGGTSTIVNRSAHLEIFDVKFKWNFGGCQGMFRECSALQKVGLFDTFNVNNAAGMFRDCSNLQEIPLFDFTNNTGMERMFYNCRQLFAIPNFNTSKVDTFRYAFSGCTSLKEIPLFDTSNVTDFSYAFQNCTSLKKIPLFDTSNVTNFSYAFYGCSSLKEFPKLNISKATNFSYTFSGCNLTEVEIDFERRPSITVTSMFSNCRLLEKVYPFNNGAPLLSPNSMFSGCSSLKIFPEKFIWPQIPAALLHSCSSILKIPNKKIIVTYSMFQQCAKIISLPYIYTSGTTAISNIFSGCVNLTHISPLDCSIITNFSDSFNQCYKLQNLILYKAGASTQSSIYISVSNCQFTAQTLIDLFNSIATNSNALTRKITIGTNYQQLLADVYVAPTSEEHAYPIMKSELTQAGKQYYEYDEETNTYNEVTPEIGSSGLYFEKVISDEQKYAIVEAGTDGAMLALDWVTNVKGWTVS